MWRELERLCPAASPRPSQMSENPVPVDRGLFLTAWSLRMAWETLIVAAIVLWAGIVVALRAARVVRSFWLLPDDASPCGGCGACAAPNKGLVTLHVPSATGRKSFNGE